MKFSSGEVVQLQELLPKLKERRQSGAKIVFTNGCFDILHVGHIRYLNEARALGDVLVVGVNSDASVRGLKGPTRPVQVEGDRAELLAALKAVDFVVVFSEPTPLELIKAIEPDVLVKGGDWPVEKIVGHEVVLGRRGQVRSLPFHDGRSTSSILEKVKRL